METRRLYRSHDRTVAGVAAGVAEYLGLDPTAVRLVWLVLVPLTGGAALVLYIVMAIVVPDEADVLPQAGPWQPGGEPVSGMYPANYFAPQPQGDPQGTQGGGEQGPQPGPTPPEGSAGAGPSQGSTETTQSWTPADNPSASTGGWGAQYAPPGDPGFSGGTPPGGPAVTPPGSPGSAPFGPPPGAPLGAASYDRRWQRRQERWERRQQRWQRRMDRWEERREDWEHGRRSGSIVWGLLLILVGGVLLMDRIDPQFSIGRTWPLLLVGFGLILVVLAFVRGIWED